MTSEQQGSSPDGGAASPVGLVFGLLARGAVLHMAVGAGTVAWDWWRQQRRRAAAVPGQARSAVGALPIVRR